MKLIIYIDYDNFCKSIEEAEHARKERIGNFSKFITEYLRQEDLLPVSYHDVVRTYVYTGEFTDNLIQKIIKKSKSESANEKYKGLLEYASYKQRWQKKFFDISINFDSFEVRTKPLQFENGKIFQKGIDVQLAVDMTAHAFNNNFDCAILCSGDVDLIESIKLTKNLGKKVIVCSSWKTSSKNIRKEADIFIDISKLSKEELNKFSFNPEEKVDVNKNEKTLNN